MKKNNNCLIVKSVIQNNNFSICFFSDPATITTITEKVYKNIGGTAYFECIAISNPMVSNMITWSRESFDMTKTKQTYNSGGKGYLTVTELAKDDSGNFFSNCRNSCWICEKNI
jgi:hypothetical protein